jgi:hypothetical protein
VLALYRRREGGTLRREGREERMMEEENDGETVPGNPLTRVRLRAQRYQSWW